MKVTLRNQITKNIFCQIAVGIDYRTPPIGLDILNNEVLKELALPPTGQPHHIGVKLPNIVIDTEGGEERILPRSPKY
ncbi:MAG: hypothetical protein OEV06_04545 [Anaerolineae bacterium]|nr:hypothetical protein [Anaerolineae bacterium]